jgi:hypothetical protein
MPSKIEEALKGTFDMPNRSPAVLSADDPRARAAARATEILEHYGKSDRDEGDLFWAPPPPDGWSYEWKRAELLGKSDSAYDVSVALGGWTAVPAERHPEMMPRSWAGGTIDRYGQRLHERPVVITDKAKDRERQRAREQIGDKEAQLGGAPPGTLQRRKSDGSSLVDIKKSYEPYRPTMDVPK